MMDKEKILAKALEAGFMISSLPGLWGKHYLY